MMVRPGPRLVFLLVVSAAYFAAVCVYISNRRMMWADEFLAWNLLSDSSWRHALQSWNMAADSGPPLFYIIGRAILAVTGLHPLAIRLYSAACLWLAAVLWTNMLRRYFPTAIAVAAVALTFLGNPEYVEQYAQVRFYGQMILGVSVATYAALWLEDNEPTPRLCFLVSFLAGAFLVTSHMLGVVYSAAILFAQCVVTLRGQKRFATIAGTLLSWTTILLFLPAVKAGANADNWMPMPGIMALVHCYANRPLVFHHVRGLSVLLNVAFWSTTAVIVWSLGRRLKSLQPPGFRLLFHIALLFVLAPVGFAIISHLYKPLWVGRYILPYGLGVSFFIAAAGLSLTTRIPALTPARLGALSTVPLAALAFVAFKEQALYPVSTLEPALRLAQFMPVALQDDDIVREAHFYAPARSQNIFYVMPSPEPGKTSNNLAAVAQGYDRAFVFERPFLQQHAQFLYIPSPRGLDLYTRDLCCTSRWTHRDLGSINLTYGTMPVSLYTRTGSSPQISHATQN